MLLSRAALSGSVVCQRLSKNVTYYMNNLASTPRLEGQDQAPEDPKPLTLMLPWLGSRPQAIAKYCDIYLRTGCDVLVVETEVKDFLWPRWGLDNGESLLELLLSEPFASRPLLVHAFSIGGFTFAQLLVHVSRDSQKYQGLNERIKGQVYDSLVVGSVETMASGLGKVLIPQFESLIKQASMLYFSLFKQYTADYFNTGIDAFRNSPVTAPALFFFCENDVMSNAPAVEELIKYWQERGVDVTAKKWAESTHAGHLKRHPQEYLSILEGFLQSLHISPLKAKL